MYDQVRFRGRIKQSLTCMLSGCIVTGLLFPLQAQEKTAVDHQMSDQAVMRAVRFLQREVPVWPADNNCFSCHNNGDGARALYRAKKLGLTSTDESLRGTLKWLKQPEVWTQYGEKAEFSDARLATLQFAVALAAARRAGETIPNDTLVDAAKRLAAFQREDGSWSANDNALIGSPVTYGPFLSTKLAIDVLRDADPDLFHDRIASAEDWLRNCEPKSVMASAAVLWALTDADDEPAKRLRKTLIPRLLAAQAPDGGWGPYATSIPEAFDTALVLLSLLALEPTEDCNKAIHRGISFLAAQQFPDGSWRATTRPPDVNSYAQQISTTAWATLALLEFRHIRKEREKPSDAALERDG